MINRNLTRQPSESESEYCSRICSLKDVYKVSWREIANFLNSELNYGYSKDWYRKKYGQRQDQNEELDYLDSKLLEINKEKIKLSEEKTQINALVKTLAREDTLKEIANNVVDSISTKKLLSPPLRLKQLNSDKNGILVISDWHYGIDISNYYNVYNPDIAKSRVNELLSECIKIINFEGIEELYVLNLGDMISGIIHLPLRLNSRIDVISQTIEVSEILSEFINELSNHCVINYGSVSDNHSRIDPNKKEALQVESFARITDWYLQKRLENNDHVKFIENKFGDDICSVNIFGHRVLAVHGDKDPQKRILTQLTHFTQEHYDMVLSAHKHHFYADEQNEIELYSNGSLMGTDDYAMKLRCNNKPSQLFIVADKDNISRAIYKIKLK